MTSNKKNVFLGLTLALFSTSVFADITMQTNYNHTGVHIAPLFLQPSSNNLKYAVFVSGHQPTHQSWHNQEINTHYTPAFELGINYAIPQSTYQASIDWLYFNSNNSDSKQASQNTDIATVEFVAPPYDVGPAVFGIKRGQGQANFNFNNIRFNIGKFIETNSNLQVRVFGGIDILRINQAVTALFNDYAGSPLVPGQSYPKPADPYFYFQTKNTSDYLGAGPDLGVDIQYTTNSGLGISGQFLGTLTAGSISANDQFKSASARLLLLGITTSYQAITAPNSTIVVPGFDSRLGLTYDHTWWNKVGVKVEAGYLFAYYNNAISQISPDTLVQAGIDSTIPEFATGTMAINSTTVSSSPFSLQGPYLNVTINLV